MRGLALLGSVGVALVMSGLLRAAATPVSPTQGATITSAHPVFAWSLPPNEQSQVVYIANNPATTTEGKFFDENLVDAGVVEGSVRQWSPPSPLFAGRYWWLVWSTDRETFQPFYSPVWAFTIAGSARVASVRVQRYTSLNLAYITVRWLANVEEPLVSARAYLGRRLIWAASKREGSFVGRLGSTLFSFRSRRAKEGARVRLVTTVRALAATSSKTTLFRAP